ncbi:Hsp70 family protein [Parenemella sanctibonifatiensis]|uniref:Chaperone HscA n=1 Tax=Parenemella sanctibonifatiensis TaxID=2016505 RepID=A0A255ELF7_9ACTN|nr:Hsp70 family protein [Parenemella sanctibonifatiensis]OYN88973.1 chaperone HscA [Parenemella sanctibonifatiensis]
MRLGIDFGTTRTRVARVDRGNYPVVSFTDLNSDAVDHIPSLIARGADGALRYGFAALAAHQQSGTPLLRSLKRHFADPAVTADTVIEVGGRPERLADLLAGFLGHVRQALLAALPDAADEPLEAMIATPAHAPGVQRFLTLSAFTEAGFTVLGIVHEPSAAGFEYTHRQPRTLNSRRDQVVVYDLGGGTFDASLIQVAGGRHEVLDSRGDNRLGGDDFDAALAGLAAPGVRASPDLLDECRTVKEAIQPQTRRIVVEVDDDLITIPITDVATAVAPLVDRSIDTMTGLVGDSLNDTSVAGIYLVGGASGLPQVARQLRDRFGQRIHRSPHPSASTAIGLAIAADPDSGFSLTERLSRGFGVFREAEGGQRVSFDPILGREARVGGPAQTRRYRPQHDIGRFRFVEYADLDPAGMPTGDIAPFADVVIPFDRALRHAPVSAEAPAHRTGPGPLMEESYTVDENGLVEVTITDREDGWSLRHSISYPAGEAPAH